MNTVKFAVQSEPTIANTLKDNNNVISFLLKSPLMRWICCGLKLVLSVMDEVKLKQNKELPEESSWKDDYPSFLMR